MRVHEHSPAYHAARPFNASTIVLGSAALLAYVCLRPLLALGHQLTVAAIAMLTHALVASGVWQPLIQWVGLDPIYAGAAIRAAGGVQVLGFAIAGPPGTWLHSIAPLVFADPAQVVGGAGVSMIAVAGAPVLGRGIAALGADVVWLAVGLWLAWRFRGRNWRIAFLGLLVQGQIVVNHLLDAHVSLADLDASGLPFAIAVAAPQKGWITGGVEALPLELQQALIGLALVVVAYLAAITIVAIVRLPRFGRAASAAAPPRGIALAGMVVALATAASPIGALAVGVTNWQLPAVSAAGMRSLRPGAAGRSRALIYAPRTAGPTPVSIEAKLDGSWRYVVDGQDDVIRGVGYNPWYAALSPGDRAAFYARDFAAMRRLGINTIEGWFEDQFDGLTLDYAARNGIGVLMPFELNQDWNYSDPAVQAQILDRLSAYIERYKNHPAVRMWAPGNENLHRILYPHWTSQEQDPAARARADAFAAFLPVLVDRIHELDPMHPVVYRDAEDVYLARLVASLGSDRPWLVYGANIYSETRLRDIVGAWPTQWPGRPLLISEFAPGGVGPAERPIGFQQDWAVIRSRPDVVLGGLAYTWATNGPEDLDRVFGLVDPSGVPTDGALAALSAVYTADAATAQAAADQPQ